MPNPPLPDQPPARRVTAPLPVPPGAPRPHPLRALDVPALLAKRIG